MVTTVGIQDPAIQILGRWKCLSYQLYIRTAPHQLAEVSQKLSKCSNNRRVSDIIAHTCTLGSYLFLKQCYTIY